VDLRNDEVVRARVKELAENASAELAAATSAVLDLPYLTPTLSVNLTITRAIFNSLIKTSSGSRWACVTEPSNRH